ncbi:hypothetical protein [Nocardia sp. CA-290969]|uniref:hypothetical protein n=1 Tax=Nocardia sp. CA-290969 TaxID=3239986 RepID=UPI003D8CF2E0
MSDTADLNEMLAAARAKEAKALADMFFTPGICKQCGAQVVFQEQHKAFHDGIEAWMKNVVRAMEKAGFETPVQRIQRRRLAAEHRAESARAGAEAAPDAARETADVLADAAEFDDGIPR